MECHDLSLKALQGKLTLQIFQIKKNKEKHFLIHFYTVADMLFTIIFTLPQRETNIKVQGNASTKHITRAKASLEPFSVTLMTPGLVVVMPAKFC